MDKDFLIWLAGFFDGEGCIIIHYDKRKDYYYLQAVITQNIKEILENVQKHFGGNLSIKKAYSVLLRPCYRLELSTKKATNLLQSIYPYLRVKRKQAELGLKFQELVYSEECKDLKQRLKLKFKQEIAALNKASVWVS